MLNLKQVEKTDAGIRVVYTVRHNVEELPTILEQDLHLVIDTNTGAVSGHLMVDNLHAPNFDEAREKMAVWCERLAAALREPMTVKTSIPIFERDYSKE